MTVPRPVRPASAWMWLTGILCMSVATLLYMGGIGTYLAPFMGHGPSQSLHAPISVRILCILVYIVHCLALICIGTAGAVIVHRAWHPHMVWRGRPEDPRFVHRAIRFYNWLGFHALSVVWRGTYVVALLGLFGTLYALYGEQIRVNFQVEPDPQYSDRIGWLALVYWPAAFLALANIYKVKKHFLPLGTSVDDLVRPDDVIDLMHERDVVVRKRAITLDVQETSFLDRVKAWAKVVVQFIQVRTCALRHRTVEIGHTDVNARWWSQQLLRGYRWGPDHRFSESQGWSFAIHFMVIVGPIILAFLTSLIGCVNPYLIPLGGGDKPMGPQKKRQVTKVQRVKKKFLVNPFSAVIVANIDPQTVDLKLNEDTLHPWTGRTGRGGGRGPGGAPGYGGGKGGGVIRFIRVKHNGEDWNRNFQYGTDGDAYKFGADYQILRTFGERTTIPIAKKPEFITIDQIKRFPKQFTPPFLYFTGRRSFNVSTFEAKVLREYMLERGGMIIGDSPGESFSGSFRGVISRALGSMARWVDIPDDDEIYRCYYALETGAPPLWHHDGFRAMGIKHQGRWIVFYHPGDMGDAWKVGHAGASQQAVDAAYELGVNLMHYSICKYIDFHRGMTD